MKVQSIKNNNIIHINKQYKSLSTSPQTTPAKPDMPAGDVVSAQNIAFHGLFDSANPDLSKRFQYGLEALDEQSLLIVTSDERDSNRKLKEYYEKINIPITKTYTLVVKNEELKNDRTLNSNFAIFKKGNDYFALTLGPTLGLLIQKPKDEYSTKNHHQEGDVTRLEPGVALYTGETIWESSGDKHKFIFMPPSRYNTENAKKYLISKSVLATSNDIQDFNRRTIDSLATIKKAAKKDNTKYFNFSDVGGLDDVIAELRKFVIRPAKYPEVFENVRLNKGILLYGPPRCGKTLLGKALAHEAGLGWWYKNANEFKSGVVGSSEETVRNYFKEIMKAPGVLFIDEFDAIAKKREGSSNARYDDSLVNQLLGCMSDLEKSDTISFIIAATNRKDLLDEAMISSGRFGLHLEVPLPNEQGLEAIFNIHAKGKKFDDDVSLPELITKMKEWEFTGSDVAEIITLGYFNALERLGINAKMDAGTFCAKDLQLISIAKADLMDALKKIANQKIAR